MLLLVAAWVVLLGVTVPAGLALLHAARGQVAFDRLADRWIVGAWLGLLTVGAALQAASLAVPLSAPAGAAIAAAAVAAALCVRAVRRDLAALIRSTPTPVALGCVALALGCAAYMAQRVVWTDTGLYHASAIRWLSEHGAVTGLALVHSRVGYSSLWFDLAAPFNDGAIRERAIAVVSGFALALASVHACVALARALGGRARDADWVALVGFTVALPVAVWWKQPVSPNPDFPLVVLPVVIASALVAVHQAEQSRGGAPRRLALDARAVPLALAAGASAIKLGGVALLAVAVLFCLWPPRLALRRLAVTALIVAALLGPALATGYVVSGCPLYPTAACFRTSWSLAPSSARAEAIAIRGYARYRAASNDTRTWTLDWVGNWLHSGQNIFIVAALLLAAAAAPRAPPRVRWTLAVGFAGVALVMYAAPDLRFALGFCGVLVAAAGLRFGAALARAARGVSGGRLAPVGLATVLALGGLAFAGARAVRPTSDSADPFAPLAPPRMSQPRDLARVSLNGIDYRVPADSLCWAAPLPCAPRDTVRPETLLRDPARGVGAGFKHP